MRHNPSRTSRTSARHGFRLTCAEVPRLEDTRRARYAHAVDLDASRVPEEVNIWREPPAVVPARMRR